MKQINLDTFNYTENKFEGPYGDIINNKYEGIVDNYHIVIFTSADGKQWLGTVRCNDTEELIGEVSGGTTAQSIVDTLNLFIKNGVLK